MTMTFYRKLSNRWQVFSWAEGRCRSPTPKESTRYYSIKIKDASGRPPFPTRFKCEAA
jgi:hypothetical protein